MDLDSDGRMDILTGSIAGKVHCYRKKPNGTYAAGETVKVGLMRVLTVGASSAISVVDWDDDGDLDLVIGNGEGAVYCVVNEGTRTKPAWGSLARLKTSGGLLSAEGGAASPCMADWDADGLPDLLVGSGSGRVVWCRNTGTKGKPTFAAPETLVSAFPPGLAQEKGWFESPRRSGHSARICVADWNGDRRLDLLVGDYAPERRGDRYQLHGWVWLYARRAASPVPAGASPTSAGP